MSGITPEPLSAKDATTLIVPSRSASLVNVPNAVESMSAKAEGRPTRSSSPARLSTELTIKYQTQLSRVNSMQLIADSLPEDLTQVLLSEIQTDLELLEELHNAFSLEHTHFELTWPVAFLDHAYFAENLHRKEAKIYRSAKLALGKAKDTLTGSLQVSTSHPPTASRFQLKFRDISLPKFSGDYSMWPAFSETFTSLILENDRLCNVERLYYLRSYMQGPPAQLISSFPLVGSSLQPSWDLLVARYENKRLLIAVQLDQLLNLKPVITGSAKELWSLISTVSAAIKALQVLGVTTDLGNHILVYRISRDMDNSTRMAWEMSLGSSLEYPRLSQLEEFLTSRARVLELIESATTSSPGSSNSKSQPGRSAKRTAHTASGSYPCELCDGDHFVVMCQKFRGLRINERRRFVIEKRLCFNCLGRHNARICHLKQGCKKCAAKHHTMLHDP